MHVELRHKLYFLTFSTTSNLELEVDALRYKQYQTHSTVTVFRTRTAMLVYILSTWLIDCVTLAQHPPLKQS